MVKSGNLLPRGEVDDQARVRIIGWAITDEQPVRAVSLEDRERGLELFDRVDADVRQREA